MLDSGFFWVSQGVAILLLFLGMVLPNLSRRMKTVVLLIAVGIIVAGAVQICLSGDNVFETSTSTPPSSALNNQELPGITVGTIVILTNMEQARRQYVFDAVDKGSAEVSLYIAPDNHFRFSVTDLSGETYVIEAPIGDTGIPLGETALVACDVGISGDASYMRLWVNKRVVAAQTFATKFDLGNTHVIRAALGKNLAGSDTIGFTATVAYAGFKTLTAKQLSGLYDATKQYLSNFPDKPQLP